VPSILRHPEVPLRLKVRLPRPRLVVEPSTHAPVPAAPGRTVLVLGGGGSLGAYQAGAVLALAEAGVVPDALVGCSAGALNAAFLASAPGVARAEELAAWWVDVRTHGVLAPSLWSRVRGFAAVAATRADALLDERPLRRLITEQVGAHDLSEFAVPLTVTTTCLDCGRPVHHDRGPVADTLVASCSLPGLFRPVRLSDGGGALHSHVDGGVLCGVPISAALAGAGPHDRVLVIDCALAPATGLPGACAAHPAAASACGLAAGRGDYVAPAEETRGALEVVLRAFAVARAAANRAEVREAVTDPRVRVLPHVADAWSAGLLAQLPSGPRDFAATTALVEAGHAATRAWLAGGGLAAAADSVGDAVPAG